MKDTTKSLPSTVDQLLQEMSLLGGLPLNSQSAQELDYESLGPIEQAMLNHPGLTREKAEEMAAAFGFL